MSSAGTEASVTRGQSKEKINTILLGALAALTEKGYANTTIDHIARASNVSRGLLHYYFKSKEDLVVRAVSLGSANLLSSAIGRIRRSTSTEDLADSMVEVLRQNAEQNPTLTSLLVEVWAESRRSAKLRMAFETGFRETTEKLSLFLKPHVSGQTNASASCAAEVMSRILLGLYMGLVIQLISQPDLINDSQLRNTLRSLLVNALNDVTSHVRKE